MASKRYAAEDIQGLLDKAQSGDEHARNDLLLRFEPLRSSLVGLCSTGNYFYRSTYQKTFLRLFAKEGTPLKSIAVKLKNALSKYSKGELISAGNEAILAAIKDTKENLSATIVYKFKDIIVVMTKWDTINMSALEGILINIPSKDNIQEIVAFDLFLMSLTEEELALAEHLIDGTIDKVPDEQLHILETLREKLSEYMCIQ